MLAVSRGRCKLFSCKCEAIFYSTQHLFSLEPLSRVGGEVCVWGGRFARVAGDVTADEDLWLRPDAQLVLSGYAILNGSQSAAAFFSDRLLLCLASWVTMLKRCVCVCREEKRG